MATIELTGHINEAGKLEVDLPAGLPAGDVRVTIDIDADDQPISPEELAEFMKTEPKTGKEIAESGLLGSWKHLGITDSRAWVEEQRRKYRRHFDE